MRKSLTLLVQLVVLVLFLRVGAALMVLGGLLLVLAYQPFLFKEKLTNGSDAERIFVLAMIFGWAYIIYKMLESKQLL